MRRRAALGAAAAALVLWAAPRGSRLRRMSPLGRRLVPGGVPDEPPVPPPLPRAEVTALPGRGEIFYRVAGDPTSATPVVLLHGWTASADLNWWAVFDELAAVHPVIAPDHRGHGRGMRPPHRFTLEECADDVAALLRHLGVAPALVVGYSMGGPIALLLWRRHRELVAGLVLQATALRWRSTPLERLRWRLMGPMALLLRFPTGRAALARLLGATELPPALRPYRAWADGEFRRADPTDVADAGRALAAFDARPFAGEVDVPTAVVITTRDRLVPPARQRALARALGAEVVEFEGDHDAAVTLGPAFARATLRALSRVSPRI